MSENPYQAPERDAGPNLAREQDGREYAPMIVRVIGMIALSPVFVVTVGLVVYVVTVLIGFSATILLFVLGSVGS